MLIFEGATLERRDVNGDTALHHACQAGHLECVRALLSRNCPSAAPDTDDAMILKAILEGDAPEDMPPARTLSPHELLVMKNKAGHTPVIKAFAGGVHVAVIRYVIGVQDGNVDPIKCGEDGADIPAVLSRKLATDGIVVDPPPPAPVEEEAEPKEKSGGLFTPSHCGFRPPTRASTPLWPTLALTFTFLRASNGVPYPVFVPPGPSSQGHRRMARFLDTMKNAVWGFDPEQVFVLTKPAVVAHKEMPTFKTAQEQKLLHPMSSLPPAAKLLYVSHRWEGPEKPDTHDAHAFAQVKRYLEEHSGDSVQYVWIDVSCINVGEKEDVNHEQYMSNVVTVLSRATHMLAVPPCKTLDPRALVRDMAVARITEKYAAEGKVPEYLVRGKADPGRSRESRAVEEEVDAAILSRKETHPEKWAALAAEPRPPRPPPPSGAPGSRRGAARREGAWDPGRPRGRGQCGPPLGPGLAARARVGRDGGVIGPRVRRGGAGVRALGSQGDLPVRAGQLDHVRGRGVGGAGARVQGGVLARHRTDRPRRGGGKGHHRWSQARVVDGPGRHGRPDRARPSRVRAHARPVPRAAGGGPASGASVARLAQREGADTLSRRGPDARRHHVPLVGAGAPGREGRFRGPRAHVRRERQGHARPALPARPVVCHGHHPEGAEGGRQAQVPGGEGVRGG
ncbi:unnamed protein product [Scytosiphon promiscuus]